MLIKKASSKPMAIPGPEKNTAYSNASPRWPVLVLQKHDVTHV
jgi:hypothetical protein